MRDEKTPSLVQGGEWAIKAAENDKSRLYIELLKRILTRYGFESQFREFEARRDLRGRLILAINRFLKNRGVELVRHSRFNPETRRYGKDWPPEAETMVGLARLDNLECCIRTIVETGIEGDFLEAGVWRGGACIFMAGVLQALGAGDRSVWLADSFQGLPKPSGRFQEDLDGLRFWDFPELAVGETTVIENFARYGLWDPERIRLVKGWFSETLSVLEVRRLALLRVDGDMYESTMDVLMAMYSRLSPGGFCLIDDYGSVPACRSAVDDFREQMKIEARMSWVDADCVFWRA